jgi:hypothetical protein
MDNLKEELPNSFLLRSVYIRSSEYKMDEKFDPLLPNQKLIGFNNFEHGQIKNQQAQLELNGKTEILNSCLITMKFNFGYKLSTNEQSLENVPFIASIAAEIAADYQVAESTFPKQEIIDQWAKSNFLIHVWPYWREYCQNTLMRMNLPVTLMPMLTLDNSQKAIS